jgi:hypothetical protein
MIPELDIDGNKFCFAPASTKFTESLLTSEKITEKCKSSDVFCQNLYAAICNNDWLDSTDSIGVLAEKYYGASWRAAGRLVASIKGEGDYIDWYCSGIDSNVPGYVPEGRVTDEIRQDLADLGWIQKK